MKDRHRRARLTTALAALALCLAAPAAARAQDESPRPAAPPQRREEINHEIQVQLLVTAEGPAGKVPPALEGVVRQLKNSLPPADYLLTSSFVHRVRDGGTLEVKSVGGSPLAAGVPQNPLTPSFLQLSLGRVRRVEEAGGQRFVHVEGFRFGLKVPIQTATVGSDKAPVIQYEDTGIVTQLSVREGEPTLVGTLNTSRAGQYFVLVLTIRRADQR